MADASKSVPLKRASGAAHHGLMELAAKLADAHRTGAAVNLTPHLEPQDSRSAYMVQKAVARELVTRPAGWKFASTPHGSVAAPMLAHTIAANGEPWPNGPARVTGIELEIAMRLTADVSPSNDWQAIAERLEGPYLGIELIGSRYGRDHTVPFLAFLADNLGNAGYVLGDRTRAQLFTRFSGGPCRIEVDGRLTFDGRAAHPSGNPIDLLRSCLADLRDTLPLLRAGQIITTGSVCGVVPVDFPRYVEGSLEGYGSVQFAVSLAKPNR
jgi:2-keto-4-pentenoate hydratase